MLQCVHSYALYAKWLSNEMRNSETTPVTAKDIGRRLGLSQPTVSRILSGAHGYRIAAETRQRVLDAAAEMGYRPNAIARSLRRRRTNIVGFYSSNSGMDSGNTFIASVLGGLQWAANAYRLDILLHGSFRGSSTEDIYGELVDGRIDGLFVMAHASDPLIARFRESSLPVVALADAIPGIPSVVCDDAHGIKILVEHLWEHGHRRIAYIRPSLRLASVETRCAAFRDAMTARGISQEAAPILSVDLAELGSPQPFRGLEEPELALDALLALPEPPTAICCWNDLTALNLIYLCKLRGIRIPEEIAVVGFDGMQEGRRTIRPLVTVGANWREITEQAMSLMARQIERRGQASQDPNIEEPLPAITTLPVHLIPGDTV